jgi:hypothetical protein
MDHDTALRLKASERYILGELSPGERDEFEVHYSDCSRCLDDVWLASTFAANAGAVFQDQHLARQTAPARAGWLDWLKLRPAPALAFSGVLNVALALGIGYQAFRVIPSMRAQLEEWSVPRVLEPIAVRGIVRGSEARVDVVAGPVLPLFVDLVSPAAYGRYTYTITSMAGDTVTGELPASAPGGYLVLLTIPVARLSPGEYTVAVSGWDGEREVKLGESRFRIPSK